MTNSIYKGLDFYNHQKLVQFFDINSGLKLQSFRINGNVRISLKHQNSCKDADLSRIPTKILNIKGFENLGPNWVNFDKKCFFFTKNVIYSKLHFDLFFS